MFYITGDIHTNIDDLETRCNTINLQENDTVIILGDVGANFFHDIRDCVFKERAEKIGCTIFCIHGNHEDRPQNIPSYYETQWNGGTVFVEKEYPNLLFAKDGEIYNFDGKKVLVMGGAYSIDKYYRACRMAIHYPFLLSVDEFKILADYMNSHYNPEPHDKELKKQADKIVKKIPENKMYWWHDEQPSSISKKACEKKLEENNWEVDIVLTHTSPLCYEPTEAFIHSINQEFIDKKTEKWLEKIEKKLKYKKWYAGHYHTNKIVNDHFEFLYEHIKPL